GAGRSGAAGKAEEARPGGVGGTDRRVGGPADTQDLQDVQQGLHVVDAGGLVEQPALDGERRLVARLTALALDGVEEGRLLAADVGARPPPELDVEAEALAHDVVAQESSPV